MINPKVRAAALDFIKSQDRVTNYQKNGVDVHEAYAAECRLFDEHFNNMTREEKDEYKDFVNWLDSSRMWESDLIVDELYDIFYQIRYDAYMEAFDSSIDEYSEEF